MKRCIMVFLALLLCLPAGGLAEEMTGLFSAAARGIGEGLEMGAAAALAGMDQELKLTLQTQSERIEAGKTIRLTVTAENPRPVDTEVAIALELPKRLSALPDTAWEAALPAAQLDAQTGRLVPSVTTFTREIELAPGGESEDALIEAEMHMGTRFYRAQIPLSLCVPDISVQARVQGAENGKIEPGDTYGYHIVVTNSGMAPKDVAVELTLPEGVSLEGELSQQFEAADGVIRGVVRAEAASMDQAGAAASCAEISIPVAVGEDALDGDEDALRLLSGSLRVDGERVPLPKLQLCGAKISARMLLGEQDLAVGEETKLRLIVVNSGLAGANVRLSCVLPDGIALQSEQEKKREDEATPAEAAAMSGGDDGPALQAQMITEEGEASVPALAQDRTLIFDLHMPAAKQTEDGIVSSTHVIDLPVVAQSMQDKAEEALMGASLAWTVDDGQAQLGDAAALRVYRAQFLGIAKEEWSAVFWAGLLMFITISCLCAAVRARNKEEDFCCE